MRIIILNKTACIIKCAFYFLMATGLKLKFDLQYRIDPILGKIRTQALIKLPNNVQHIRHLTTDSNGKLLQI